MRIDVTYEYKQSIILYRSFPHPYNYTFLFTKLKTRLYKQNCRNNSYVSRTYSVIFPEYQLKCRYNNHFLFAYHSNKAIKTLRLSIKNEMIATKNELTGILNLVLAKTGLLLTINKLL